MRSCLAFSTEPIQPSALKCRYCSSDLPDSFRASASPIAGIPATANDRLKSQIALIQQGKASIETYTEVASALGGSLTPKGFLVDMHYLIDLGGVKSRVDKFEDLRQWFLDNVASRVSA